MSKEDIFITTALIQLDMPYEIEVRVDGKLDTCHYFFGTEVSTACKRMIKSYKKKMLEGKQVKLEFKQFGHITTIKL